MTTALGLSQRTLERLLKRLKSEKKVVFRGAPKTGGYFPAGDED
jgi:ATP-dependent DNA helicase RecG